MKKDEKIKLEFESHKSSFETFAIYSGSFYLLSFASLQILSTSTQWRWFSFSFFFIGFICFLISILYKTRMYYLIKEL